MVQARFDNRIDSTWWMPDFWMQFGGLGLVDSIQRFNLAEREGERGDDH